MCSNTHGTPRYGETVKEPRDAAEVPRGAVTFRAAVVLALDMLDGRVQVVRSVVNPDKLGHIGPVADAWALMRETPPGPDR